MTTAPRARVLLTGSTGTVGGAVLDALLKSGLYEVRTTVRHPLPFPPQADQRVVDLNDPRFPDRLADTEYDAIIHCAQPRYGEALGATGEPFDLTVVKGLERLATAKTRRLIYTSGVWIYGHQAEGEVIRESSPVQPVSYAVDRLQTLDHVRNSGRATWIEAILPSLVYGASGPFIAICDAIRAGHAHAIDDPSIRWSLIEQTDLGRAYRCLLKRNFKETAFLIAEKQALSIVELHKLLAGELDVPFAGTPKAELRGLVSAAEFEVMTMNQPVDSSLFRRVTGWKNRHVFADRFRELVPSS